MPWLVASVLYVAFVDRGGVNVPFSDDWSMIALLQGDISHQLGLSALWAQHNENRMIIPNLIFLYVARHARDFEVVMMRLGAIMFCVGNLFVLLAIRTRSEVNSWLASGVNFVATGLTLVGLFSLAAVENIFWAFQFAWFFIYALSALAILMIVYFERRGFPLKRTLVSLIAIAVVASISSSQGLFVFISEGAAILFFALAKSDRGERRHYLLVAFGVLASFVVTAGIYFYNLNFAQITAAPSRHNGIAYLYEYFTTVATTYSFGLTHHGSVLARDAVSCIYLVIIVVTLARFLRYRALPDPVVVFFVTFAVIFELAVTMSRHQFGLTQGASSRYALYFLPAVGVLPLLVQGWLRRSGPERTPRGHFSIDAINFRSPMATVARLGLLGLVAFTCYKVDTNFGIPAAKAIKAQRMVAAAQVKEYPKWNAQEVRLYLYPSSRFIAPYVLFFQRYESGFTKG